MWNILFSESIESSTDTTSEIKSRSNLKTKDEANLQLAFGNVMYDLENYSDVSNSVESCQLEIHRFFIAYESRE